MYQRLVVNEREIRAVTACRDALLPKLISGELRLKEANPSQLRGARIPQNVSGRREQ